MDVVDDQRAVRTTNVNDMLWLHLVDPREALAARAYSTDDRLVVELDLGDSEIVPAPRELTADGLRLRIEQAIASTFDLRPGAILLDLGLTKPIYTPTAAYGHFGREDIDVSWEKTDKAEALAGAVAA